MENLCERDGDEADVENLTCIGSCCLDGLVCIHNCFGTLICDLLEKGNVDFILLALQIQLTSLGLHLSL